MSRKISEWFRTNYRSVIIVSLVIVPFLVSLISTIHVVNFFKLSNFTWLAVTLAVAFEIGALSSLAAIAVMDKINKYSLWSVFILITLMQMMGNTYYAFDFITIKMKTHPEWTQNWIDLFSITGEDVPATKRILAIVSGAILPIISLTFLHMLITYITKSKPKVEEDYEYEEIYVDENGNEIENHQETVHIPFVRNGKDLEDTKDIKTVLTTATQNVDYTDVNEVIEEKPTIKEPIVEDRKDTKKAINPTIRQKEQIKESDNIPDIKTQDNSVNPLIPFLTELVKNIKFDNNNPNVIKLKKPTEINPNGQVKINLEDFMSPADKENLLKLSTKQYPVKNTNTNINNDRPQHEDDNDDEEIISVVEHQNNISEDVPTEINSEPAPEIMEPVIDLIPPQEIEDSPLPTIEKDTTFETIQDTVPDDTIPIENELDQLKMVSPQKKKILLYKEKKN